jgi:predicted nucleic-acid-binding Zn-ribbon protein
MRLTHGIMNHGASAIRPRLPTANQPPSASSTNQKPKGNICPRCAKPVYFAEEVKAVGQVKTNPISISNSTFLFNRSTNYVTDVPTVKRASMVQAFRNTTAIFMMTVRLRIDSTFIIFILLF